MTCEQHLLLICAIKKLVLGLSVSDNCWGAFFNLNHFSVLHELYELYRSCIKLHERIHPHQPHHHQSKALLKIEFHSVICILNYLFRYIIAFYEKKKRFRNNSLIVFQNLCLMHNFSSLLKCLFKNLFIYFFYINIFLNIWQDFWGKISV